MTSVGGAGVVGVGNRRVTGITSYAAVVASPAGSPALRPQSTTTVVPHLSSTPTVAAPATAPATTTASTASAVGSVKMTTSPKLLSSISYGRSSHDIDFPPPMISSLAMAMATASVPISASSGANSRYDLYVPFSGATTSPSAVPQSTPSNTAYGAYGSTPYGAYGAVGSSPPSDKTAAKGSTSCEEFIHDPHAASMAAANAIRRAALAATYGSSTTITTNDASPASTSTSSSSSLSSGKGTSDSVTYSENGYAAVGGTSNHSDEGQVLERVASSSTCDTLDHQLLLRTRHAFPAVPAVMLPSISSAIMDASLVSHQQSTAANDFSHKLGAEYAAALKRDWYDGSYCWLALNRINGVGVLIGMRNFN
jgi:hypothetical protein